MATLAFDGPGQGGGEYDFPLRGDYEVPVALVLEFATGLDGIRADRMAL